MVRYLFYTIGDLTYQSPLVRQSSPPFLAIISFLTSPVDLKEMVLGHGNFHSLPPKIFLKYVFISNNITPPQLFVL